LLLSEGEHLKINRVKRKVKHLWTEFWQANGQFLVRRVGAGPTHVKKKHLLSAKIHLTLAA
jgi:hypothetical protein